jgi:hypothetical protein
VQNNNEIYPKTGTVSNYVQHILSDIQPFNKTQLISDLNLSTSYANSSTTIAAASGQNTYRQTCFNPWHLSYIPLSRTLAKNSGSLLFRFYFGEDANIVSGSATAANIQIVSATLKIYTCRVPQNVFSKLVSTPILNLKIHRRQIEEFTGALTSGTTSTFYLKVPASSYVSALFVCIADNTAATKNETFSAINTVDLQDSNGISLLNNIFISPGDSKNFYSKIYNHDFFNLSNGLFITSGTQWYDEIRNCGKESLSGAFLLNQNYRLVLNPGTTIANATIRVVYWFRGIASLDINRGDYSEIVLNVPN